MQRPEASPSGGSLREPASFPPPRDRKRHRVRGMSHQNTRSRVVARDSYPRIVEFVGDRREEFPVQPLDALLLADRVPVVAELVRSLDVRVDDNPVAEFP